MNNNELWQSQREMIIPEAVVETVKNHCCIHAGAGGTRLVRPHDEVLQITDEDANGWQLVACLIQWCGSRYECYANRQTLSALNHLSD